jgi:mannosyltransferase
MDESGIESGETRRLRWLVAVLVVEAALLWLLPLGSSFWTDEIHTYWTAKDGPAVALRRIHEIPEQSKLYQVIASSVAPLGKSEALLRLPSVLAATLAAWLVYRLGRRLFDRETGVIAALVFAALPNVFFAAADARCYAFEIAASAAAMLALAWWLEGGGWRRGIVYAALAALPLYFHFVYLTALVPHAIYFAARRRAGGPVSALSFAAALLGAAILSIPLLPQLFALAGARHGAYALPTPPLSEIAAQCLPVPALVIGAFAGVLLVHLAGTRVAVKPARSSPQALVLAAAMHLAPIAIVWVVTRYTTTKIYRPRYLAFGAPGLALLVAFALRSVEPPRARTAAVLGMALAAVVSFARPRHTVTDWRSGLATAAKLSSETTPVLLWSGLIDSDSAEWRARGGETLEFLTCSVAYQPIPGRILLVPYSFSASNERYLESLVESELKTAARVLFVGQLDFSDASRSWFDGRLGAEGFEAHAIEEGNVAVVVYERRPR